MAEVIAGGGYEVNEYPNSPPPGRRGARRVKQEIPMNHIPKEFFSHLPPPPTGTPPPGRRRIKIVLLIILFLSFSVLNSSNQLLLYYLLSPILQQNSSPATSVFLTQLRYTNNAFPALYPFLPHLSTPPCSFLYLFASALKTANQ